MNKRNAGLRLHSPKNRFPIIRRAVLSLLFLTLSNLVQAADVSAPSPSASAPVSEVTFPIREFRLLGNQVMPTELLLAKLVSLQGENRTLKDLVTARDVVISTYREAGYYLVGVGLPAAIATDGVVTLRIVETTVGAVRLGGNQRFSEANLRRQLPVLVEGAAPNVAELTREIFVANDNPARQITVNFTPPSNGVVDAEVQVTESNPLLFTLALDSSGSSETGRTRVGLSIRHANMFDRSHVLTAGYRTSLSQPEDVKIANFAYQIPFPTLAGRVQLSATYADINVGRVFNAFEVAGKYTNVGVNYLYDLKRDANSRHGLEIAFAEKRYQPTVLFGGVNLVTAVNARPLGLGYHYASQSPENVVAFDFTHFRNLTFGNGNDDTTYNASRATADADWGKSRLKATYQRQLGGDWLLRARGVAQYSSEPLIDVEALFVGGINSVRGLLEGDLLGDRGYFTNLELHTPMFADAHRLLAFVDNGRITRINPQPGEKAGDGATTWGLGWRYARRGKAEFALDWAKVAAGTDLTPKGDSSLNFRLITRF